MALFTVTTKKLLVSGGKRLEAGKRVIKPEKIILLPDIKDEIELQFIGISTKL